MANPNPKPLTQAARRKGGIATRESKKAAKKVRMKDWDDLRELMLNAGADRIARYLNRRNVSDAEFFEKYLKLLNYFKPKIQSATIEQKGTININITSDIKNVDDI